jgi:hypothetical protein
MSQEWTTATESQEERFDNIKDLYIGRIDQTLGGIRTKQGEADFFWTGETLLYVKPDDEQLTVQIRRVAFHGTLVDPAWDERLGVVSLSSTIEEGQVYGVVGDARVRLQLHYAELSRQTHERLKEYDSPDDEDATFPFVEEVEATLSWEIKERNAENFWLAVNLEMKELIAGETRIVEGLRLAYTPVLVRFILAGTGEPRPKPTYSLPSNCPPLPLDCAEDTGSVTRTLAIRFVDLSSQDQNHDLAQLCRNQIEGVCDVWRSKSCLDLDVEHEIVQGSMPDRNKYKICTKQKEGEIQNAGYADPNALDIYLVDKLTTRIGGGVAHDSNQASCYIILEVGKLGGNLYLLAHELCHAVGLSHPGTQPFTGWFVGSAASIAQPGTPNSPAQSWHNLRVFTVTTHPLNPLLQTTTTPDCFRPNF